MKKELVKRNGYDLTKEGEIIQKKFEELYSKAIEDVFEGKDTTVYKYSDIMWIMQNSFQLSIINSRIGLK